MKRPWKLNAYAVKHHLLYRTTCLNTGRWYIGIHSTSNKNDSYLGSGKVLLRSIKKHGRDQHVREILEELPSRESLVQREMEVVTEDLVRDRQCMNTKLGGHGGFDHLTVEHRHKSHATLKNRREADPDFEREYREKMAANGKQTDVRRAHAALRAKYQDAAFKTKQVEALRQANIGLRRMTDSDGKRRKIHLSELPSKIALGWTIGWK